VRKCCPKAGRESNGVLEAGYNAYKSQRFYTTLWHRTDLLEAAQTILSPYNFAGGICDSAILLPGMIVLTDPLLPTVYL
jgi:hypothetical protein